MTIKQLSIFLENKSGRLVEVTETLAQANINMLAFSIADTAEFGILRIIVDKPEEAQKVLKERELSVHITEVIGLIVPHEPGGLNRAIKILASEGISIEYMYAFPINNRVTVIIRTDSSKETIEALQRHKLELLKSSDIYEI